MCEWEEECICMVCRENAELSCGCDECDKFVITPFFWGDCINFQEKGKEQDEDIQQI